MEPTIIKFEDQSFTLFPRDEADVSVMREIFKLREYRRVDEIIKSAKNPILDVGGHAGFFCLYARALNAAVPIWVMEPEENNLMMLDKHLKVNGIKKVKIIKGALAKESGERNLVISEDSHNHFLDINKAGEGQKVATYSLADLCRDKKIKQFSLIKMDIEGGEFEVIESLQPKHFSLFQNIILEYHNSSERHYRTLETKLRENGFSVQIFPSHFDKTMGFIFAANKRLR